MTLQALPVSAPAGVKNERSALPQPVSVLNAYYTYIYMNPMNVRCPKIQDCARSACGSSSDLLNGRISYSSLRCRCFHLLSEALLGPYSQTRFPRGRHVRGVEAAGGSAEEGEPITDCRDTKTGRSRDPQKRASDAIWGGGLASGE